MKIMDRYNGVHCTANEVHGRHPWRECGYTYECMGTREVNIDDVVEHWHNSEFIAIPLDDFIQSLNPNWTEDDCRHWAETGEEPDA